MPKFRPQRAQDENVHTIEALGGFRAVTRVWDTEDGLTVQGWRIESFSDVDVTATSTHSAVSTFSYANTGNPEILDHGKRWQFDRKLQESRRPYQPANEPLVASAQPHGQIATKVAAVTESRLKGSPFKYETVEQQLDWA